MVLQDFAGVEGALRHHSAGRVDQVATIQRQRLAFVDAVEDVVANIVNERDPRLQQNPRPQVGIAA